MTNAKSIFEKEATEKDVLNRLKWDSSIDSNRFSLTYVDRFEREEKEVYIDKIIFDGGDFFGTVSFDDKGEKTISQIPLHRIRKFKENENIVWMKRKCLQ